MHFQSWFSLYFCNDGCFEVFLASSLQELFSVFLGNNHCHSFLRFTDSNFCTVQTVIFLRNSVQVDFQTVGQFADGNGNTACTEVVAAFNHLGDIRVTEQPL